MLVFRESGKPEYPEKKPSKQRREPATNSTHIWCRRRKSKPGHIDGRRDSTALITATPLLPTLTHASKYHFHKIELDRFSTWQGSGLRIIRYICSTHLQIVREYLEQIYSLEPLNRVQQLVSPRPPSPPPLFARD